MSRQKLWNKQEEQLLIEKYSTMGGNWCAKKLKRSKNSVNLKANRLGLKRDGDFRYDRPKAPEGYISCFNCEQVLPEGQFYKKKDDGFYGKKSNLCKSCAQESARRSYRNNKEKHEKRKKENPVKILLINIKARAKAKNIPFDLTEKDLTLPKTCPVLGIEIIPFDNSDNSPSVDRFVPELGYIKNNCQIISRRANRIKNNATLEEIEKLYNWMKKFTGRQI